jgi:DNA repair protein RadD
MKQLRPYQDAAIKSLFKYLFENPGKNPLVVAPVAAGKSLMIADFIRQLHELYPRTRIVVLTHVKELLIQNSEELDEQYFGCDVGFYCAGLNQKRLHNDVTFASIQSIHNKFGDFNRPPEIIIIDECHLISHKGTTQYRKFIDAILSMNPNCRVVGFTGTPFRADTGRLDEGKGKLFDGIAYEIGMDYMIEQGFWAKPVCPELATKMDVHDVAVRGGDYVIGDLERAVNTTELNDACTREMIEKGQGRKKWLVFTAGVQHAADVTADIESFGISVGMVTGDTEKTERDRIISDFRAGKIRCLVNVAVLTTGFNVPDIDMLVFMRPTRSPVLYIQTIGRGVRPVYAPAYDLSTQQGRLNAIAASIKPDCMVLDFGGVVSALGPIDQVSIKKSYKGESEGGGEAIMKICPSCGTECHAAQRYCYSCSYCFIKLEDQASNKAIMSRDVEPEWVDVLETYYDKHHKENALPSLKITYHTMQGAIREWICFEHHKYDVEDPKRFAWNKAVDWHKARLPDCQVPVSIEEALEKIYPRPSKILVRPDGKYWRILDYEFNKIEEFVEPDTKDYFEIAF